MGRLQKCSDKEIENREKFRIFEVLVLEMLIDSGVAPFTSVIRPIFSKLSPSSFVRFILLRYLRYDDFL